MKLIMNYPAAWWGQQWREALPSGNGRLGAAVYGAVHEERIMLSHTDLWRGGKSPELPDVSDLLPEVRQRLLANDPIKADRILADALKERGYQPQISWPLPLGDLLLTMRTRQAFKHYRRTLDMETGEVFVSWRDGEVDYQRRLFVSRPRDMMVLEVEARGDQTMEATLTFALHDPNDRRRPAITLPEHVETVVDGCWIQYAAQNDDGTDFGALACVTADGGTLESAAGGRLVIRGARKVLVRVAPFIRGERTTAWQELRLKLEHTPADYSILQKEHAHVHGALFRAMRFDLGAESRSTSNEELLLQAYQGEAPLELVEKMWAFGRYLLLSASSPDSNPCHLYGLWCGEYDGIWAFHMMNENLQMIYWQALSGNMPELLLSVFRYVEAQMDDYRMNARRLYGCRGIYIPAPNVPGSGLLKHVSPHIIHWTGGAGWIAQHYYDYYLHTNDVGFLRDRALPFLRETALFYEDFFTIGEDGYFISSPSNSPENTPGNHWNGQGMGVHMETTMNATMDFAIAKEVLTHLLEGSALAGIYAEERSKWEAMLRRIPPYQLNEDGAVREWMHPFFTDNYHHRHQSHLYPVFPGTEITRESDPALFEAFVTTVRKRLVVGLNQQTGWSLAHMANNYARMREGDQALECLDIMSRSCILNNFFTLHNDWRRMGLGVSMEKAPVQLDANMGWTAAVQEMLLFSLPGKLYVLPALPERWRKGAVGPMLARGSVEVNLEWDQDEGFVQVELLSRGRGQTVEILLPGDKRVTQELEADVVKPIKLAFGPEERMRKEALR